jgi:crossover junction endodeoxyribonuclease RuvC
MKIIAIDPGYERLGIAILEKNNGGKETLLYSNCIFTTRSIPHSQRLAVIGTEISRLIEEYEPEALAIETLFFSNNQKTALLVAEARGVALFAAAHKGLQVIEFHPANIKIAVTGHGRSDKAQVTAMVKKIVKINKTITYDDEYDAIAIGITYFATEKSVIHRK